MHNMFNPEMMNQMKGMMNPQMMKQAASSFANMSDDQIRSYLTATGMGHMDPQTFRQMSGNLTNMNDNDLERMKNSNPNFTPNLNSINPTPNTCSNTSSNNFTNKSSSSSINYDTPQTTKKKTIVDQLEDIKNKGNEFFRQTKYKEACEKYYEALNELEYISDSDKLTHKKEIENLEVVCRLNIANSKLKMEDYDLVIHECLKVLKKTDNFKAHYRAGVSYYKKANYSKASHHFTKAKELNQNEEVQQIAKYLDECNKFVEDLESEKRKVENNINTNETNNEKEKKNENINTIPNNTTASGNSNIDKLKEILKNDINFEDNKKEEIFIKRNDEILIEEVKKEEPVNTSFNRNNSPLNINNTPLNTNEMINKAERELSNMDDTQLNSMISMFKTMDSATIKSMMSAQGMNISDEQIEMMKNNMSPDMMRMMKNYSGGNTRPNNNPINPINPINTNNTVSTSTPTTTPMPNPFPNGLPDLKNMDMSSMMQFVQSNPQLMNMMGPQMSQMFGEKGMNNDMMMKSMQNIMWLMSLPQRIKAFFTSPRGILFLLFVLVLIIAYLYR